MNPARVLLLLLLFVSVFPIACVPTTAEPEPSINQNTLNSGISTSYPAPAIEQLDTNNVPSPGYPAPVDEHLTTPPSPFMELSPYPAPISEPPPRITPWPSPVREERPTPTALPLPKPADNAAGSLYLVGSEDNAPSEIFTIPMGYDETVVLETQHKLPAVQLRSSYPPRLFPSPTGDMLVVIESVKNNLSDVITVINLSQGIVSEWQNNRSPEMPYAWRFESWHPDGRHFLISDDDRFRGLWLVDSLGINTPLKLTEHNPDTAAFSPTGQILAYVHRPLLSDQTLLMSAWGDGSHPEIIVQETAKTRIMELSWSADGDTLAYVVGSTELWLYRQGKPDRLVNDYRARYGYAWSPDGRYIAYIARTGPDGPPLMEGGNLERFMHKLTNTALRIVDTQTSERFILQYDNETIGAFSPSWSPDGQHVIYTAVQNGKFAIMRLNFSELDTAPAEKMVYSDSMISAAVWIMGGK